MLVLRLTTRGARSVAVRTPFTWSHCMWFAIAAEPPLPQENTRGTARVGLEEDRRRAIERGGLDRARGPGELVRVGAEVCRGARVRRGRELRRGGPGRAARRSEDRGRCSYGDTLQDEWGRGGEARERPDTRALAVVRPQVDRRCSDRLREADVLRPVAHDPRRGQVEVRARPAPPSPCPASACGPRSSGRRPRRLLRGDRDSTETGRCAPRARPGAPRCTGAPARRRRCPYSPRATPAWFVTTATGMPARLNLAIASGDPSMNSTRSTEPTYPWSTMIVPSRSSRIPGRGHELRASGVPGRASDTPARVEFIESPRHGSSAGRAEPCTYEHQGGGRDTGDQSGRDIGLIHLRQTGCIRTGLRRVMCGWASPGCVLSRLLGSWGLEMRVLGWLMVTTSGGSGDDAARGRQGPGRTWPGRRRWHRRGRAGP